jgi:hypothetical protein
MLFSFILERGLQGVAAASAACRWFVAFTIGKAFGLAAATQL